MRNTLKALSASRKVVARILRTRTIADQGGQALIELALSMTIYTTMIIGAAEFARLCFCGIEVASAARAGAGYGAQNHTTDTDTSTMISVARADAVNVTVLTATASTICKCSNGVAITCANASTACAARTITYVQVLTTATINPIFRLPFLPSTYTLNGEATMRVLQ